MDKGDDVIVMVFFDEENGAIDELGIERELLSVEDLCLRYIALTSSGVYPALSSALAHSVGRPRNRSST